ncbi:NUDIX hydrolase [Planctomycetes bacterium K23_9]|uniref:Bifunctional NMN adenylyltransferase/Nudix hydrolase n=1 Tax=Stieleria marina TaxID=1930275 RepID=A0A517NR23_9BACT|nr:Bifunctional NMN adenylyltransferase/Nudix hydrolase [Planctomycetes bacterium K23_9]
MTTESNPIESVYRFCPRCGAESRDVGSVPFRCHSCQFSLFFGPVAAVGGLVVDAEQRLLLVRRSRDPGKGLWGLPGGFVDRDENVEEALAREVIEETQLVVTSSKLLMTGPNQYNYQGVVSPVIDLFYLCEVADSTVINLAADELDQFVWVQPGPEYLESMAFESNRRAVEFWLASLKRR